MTIIVVLIPLKTVSIMVIVVLIPLKIVSIMVIGTVTAVFSVVVKTPGGERVCGGRVGDGGRWQGTRKGRAGRGFGSFPAAVT